MIAGVFFAVLIYLEQQGMVNINWDKINVAYTLCLLIRFLLMTTCIIIKD
jgi:uncharacterized membrane protein (Fun14 family)